MDIAITLAEEPTMCKYLAPRIFLILASAWFAAPATAAETALAPWPRKFETRPGSWSLSSTTRVVAEASLAPLADVAVNDVRRLSGLLASASRGPVAAGDIQLVVDTGLHGEEYRIEIGDRVKIAGGAREAVANGWTTLVQLLGQSTKLPFATIEDRPRFAYRGAMLDVARKPYSIDTLKQCIDVCRFYKVRYLHLHLTDENAWTIPSAKYPQLGTHNFAWAGGAAPRPYGVEELKGLVAYGDARGVTLVPEIEVPGHSGQLRGTLPAVFGYTDAAGKPAPVGVINFVSDDALRVLDELMGEVAQIFSSSPFIHIGCDEASLGGVDETREMKAYLAKTGRKNSAEAFNDFVIRMHGVNAKHGKKTIVWEGAPLGPREVPKDLIVMPWVGGSQLGGELDRAKRPLINAPWGVNGQGFDPFQVNGSRLDRTTTNLIGATTLLWQMPEQNAVPHLRALAARRAEATWNPDLGRSPEDLARRLWATDPILDRLLAGVTLDVRGAADGRPLDRAFTEMVSISPASRHSAHSIRYTLNREIPTMQSPTLPDRLVLRRSATLTIRPFAADGRPTGHPLVREFVRVPGVPHSAVGARISFDPPAPGYFGNGPAMLVDGRLADGDESAAAGWMGWERTPVRITLDLGRPTAIRSLAVHCLRAAGGIFLPESATFSVSSDGQTFRAMRTIDQKAGSKANGWYVAAFPETSARYVRIETKPHEDWTFIDEAAVNPELPRPTARHAARGRPVAFAHAPPDVYHLGDLTDGVESRTADFLNPTWVGVEGRDFDATVDLGKSVDVRRVGINFLQYVGAGIMMPPRVELHLSDDGKAFRKIAELTTRGEATASFIRRLSLDGRGERGRYVRLVAKTHGQWIFADEFLVNPVGE